MKALQEESSVMITPDAHREALTSRDELARRLDIALREVQGTRQDMATERGRGELAIELQSTLDQERVSHRAILTHAQRACGEAQEEAKELRVELQGRARAADNHQEEISGLTTRCVRAEAAVEASLHNRRATEGNLGVLQASLQEKKSQFEETRGRRGACARRRRRGVRRR